MSCDPVLVTGWVDGALDAAAMAAVEEHVASCSACRAQVAEERTLRAALRSLPALDMPRGLPDRVRRRVASSGRGSAWRVLLPLAAVLILSIGWLRTAPPFVALELSRDHGHCFGKPRLPARVWSNDPAVVMRWFEQQGTRMPLVPEAAGGLELVGARYCTQPDFSRAAHLYYEGGAGSEQVSIFVVQHHVSLSGSYSRVVLNRAVMLTRVNDTTVAIVSDKAELVQAFHKAMTTTVAEELPEVVDPARARW